MIVMCEGCETSFNVDDRMIRPTGSKVRCSKCRHVFMAYPAAAAADTEEPLTLQDELSPATAPGETAGLNEIDSQLDALFGEKASTEGQAASAGHEPELLNVDDLLAEDAPAADPLAAEKLGDDSGLDLDLGLSLEEDSGKEEQAAKASPQAAAGAPAASAGEPSIDFSMDLEPSVETPAEPSLPSLEEMEISLDDLDKLDEEAAAETAPRTDVPSEELELDLDLETLAPESADAPLGDAAEGGRGAVLEPASAETKAAPKSADEDELDLSDLEEMLEGEGSPAASAHAATPELDLDLDLGAAAGVDAKSGEMQELDLTAIAGGPQKSPVSAAAPADELDFSDISGVLEEKTPATPVKSAEEPTEDLDLVFEDELPAAAANANPVPPSKNQEDLMLDIETLLEEGEEKKPSAAATEELDLDFASEPVRANASDMEIEIEPVDEGFDTASAADRPEAAAPTAAVAAAGVAAAAAASMKPGQDAPSTDEFSTDEFTQAGMTGATDVLETEVAQTAKPRVKKTKAPRRSWGRKLVVAALGVLVLAIATLVIPRTIGIQIPYLSDLEIPYLSDFLKDFEIPYLGKIFQSEPEDTAGSLKIAPVSESLSAEFIDNRGAGRLCVIKGQVRNNYDHPRSFIRVTAKLYSKNKTLAKTATVFAGNVLSNQELAAQDLAAITGRLKNKNGVNNLNVGVKPGRSIPFMAVFDNLPGNLEEYSVEVAGSSK
jgi:pilus assembly protein FimV